MEAFINKNEFFFAQVVYLVVILLARVVNAKPICIILIVSASYLSGKEVNSFNLIGAEKQQLVFI